MVGDIFQPTHLLFVLVVALLVLGPKRLPEVGRTLGSGIRDFRAALNGERSDDKDDDRDELDTHAWTSEPEPEDKHEFAHAHAESTPPHHEFAHEAPSEAPAANGANASSTPAPNGSSSTPAATGTAGAPAAAPDQPASPQD